MLVQCVPIAVAELTQQSRRAFDVRKQKRHHAAWEISRH
jgi:hypothetical protein